MTSQAGSSVHFGSFDAEAAWRPAGLARLPTGPELTDTSRILAMEELLAVGAEPGDVLLTTAPMAPVLAEVLAGAGIRATYLVIPGAPTQSIEERTALASTGPLSHLRGLAAAPYAIGPHTAAAVDRLGLRADLPDLETVARVNSKTWSNDLVGDLGLPGSARIARSPEQVREFVEEAGGSGAVLKDPYGVSGKGTLHVSTPRMLNSVVNHLDRQLRQGLGIELLVQPLWPNILDFSSHFLISETGAVEWLGLQGVDNAGFVYRGSGPIPPDHHTSLDERALQDVLSQVATALFKEGYVGPVCVDGMCLRDGTVVPLLEINARRSMGWLNLRLDQRARQLGLRSWLRCRNLAIGVEDPVERLVDTLTARGLLFDGTRPGILPLSTRTATRPRGRLFYAVLATDPADVSALESALDDAVDAAQIGRLATVPGPRARPTEEGGPL
jgi:hypothetical protein